MSNTVFLVIEAKYIKLFMSLYIKLFLMKNFLKGMERDGRSLREI